METVASLERWARDPSGGLGRVTCFLCETDVGLARPPLFGTTPGMLVCHTAEGPQVKTRGACLGCISHRSGLLAGFVVRIAATPRSTRNRCSCASVRPDDARMSFAAMSAQVVTPDAYNKLQQDHEQLRAKTAQLVGQFKALKAEKETRRAEAAAKNDAVVAKTRELVARYKASQAEVEDLRSKAGAPDPALVERSRALAARYKQLQGEKAAADAEIANLRSSTSEAEASSFALETARSELDVVRRELDRREKGRAAVARGRGIGEEGGGGGQRRGRRPQAAARRRG